MTPSSLLAFLHMEPLPSPVPSNDLVQQKHLLHSNHTDRMRVSSYYTCSCPGISGRAVNWQQDPNSQPAGDPASWRPIPKASSYGSATTGMGVSSRHFFCPFFLIHGGPIDFGKDSCTQKTEQSRFSYKLHWGACSALSCIGPAPDCVWENKVGQTHLH